MTKRKKQAPVEPVEELPYHVTDGEWFPVVQSESWECCGCGLVHVIEHKVTERGLEWSWTVDEEETRAARLRKVKTEPVR